MSFRLIRKSIRNLLTVSGIRKRKILVLSNQRNNYSDTINDFRILSGLNNPRYSKPVLCSTLKDFTREIAKGYEIVHLAVHGTDNQIELSDDEPGISHNTINGLFQNNFLTELVFLNVCRSYNLAEAISENVPYVIGWKNDPGISDHGVLCSQFYNSFIEGNNSISDAFIKSSSHTKKCFLFHTKNGSEFKAAALFRRLKIWFISLLILSLFLIMFLTLRSCSNPEIISPVNDSVVNNPVDVLVSAPCLGKNSKLWIFVCTPGEIDVWWPQGKAEKMNSGWEITVNCGNEGGSGKYKICAMVVSGRTDKDLHGWVASQTGERKMAPLTELPPGRIWLKYHTINVIRKD